MERKLASVQQIAKIEPIENADNIERVTVLGWQLVVLKNEFEVGNLCVFCEVDSLLPVKPEFEFLRKFCYNPRMDGFRIKTVRMRGQISQGIVFPINIMESPANLKIGDDVTELLGICKFERPIPTHLRGIVKGYRPFFIPETDEIRIQSVPDVLVRHANKTFYITEKLDGTSGSFFTNDGEFGVCSRSLELKESDENTFWQIARKYDIEKKLRSLDINFAIQAEVCGPGIQKNRYKFKEHKLFLFNAFDIDQYKYVNVFAIADKLGLETVPMINNKFVLIEGTTVNDLVEMAIARSVLNDIHREGIVIRAITEEQDQEIGRLSFKVINPKYLLKYDE